MKNEIKDPYKIRVRKYLSFSFAIFSIGISIATLSSLYLTNNKEFDGTSVSIIMTFLVLAYTYFQYQTGEIEAEKREKENQKQTEIRRLNDIKLSVYNQLISQSNIILEDCSKLLIDINPKLSEDAKDIFSHIAVTINAKFNRIEIDIDNFNKLLNTNISMEDIDKVQEQMTPILKELKNRVFKSVDDCAGLYATFHKNINDFAYMLSKELL